MLLQGTAQQLLVAECALVPATAAKRALEQHLYVNLACHAQVITNKLASEKYVVYSCGTAKPTVSGVSKMFEGPLVSVSVNDGGAADYMVSMKRGKHQSHRH